MLNSHGTLSVKPAPHFVLGMSPPDCTLVGAQAAECVVLQPGVAQALRAGQVTPLLLASPPGYAIVPKTDNPRRIDQWRVMYQQLGIGPAAQALQARMQGQFILSQHPSTRDYVLDVPYATYTVHCQGQHGKLPISAICWDDRGRNLDANAPHTFVVNANNSISPTKATHLVFGIRGALLPLAAAQHVAQPTAQSVPVVQSVPVAQSANVPMGMPVEAAAAPHPATPKTDRGVATLSEAVKQGRRYTTGQLRASAQEAIRLYEVGADLVLEGIRSEPNSEARKAKLRKLVASCITRAEALKQAQRAASAVCGGDDRGGPSGTRRPLSAPVPALAASFGMGKKNIQ